MFWLICFAKLLQILMNGGFMAFSSKAPFGLQWSTHTYTKKEEAHAQVCACFAGHMTEKTLRQIQVCHFLRGFFLANMLKISKIIFSQIFQNKNNLQFFYFFSAWRCKIKQVSKPTSE